MFKYLLITSIVSLITLFPKVAIAQYYSEARQIVEKSDSVAGNELVEEVIEIIENKYIDPAATRKREWISIRNRFLHYSYNSKEEVYDAIRKMLEQLGDVNTRFLDPHEFELMTIGFKDDKIGIGLKLTIDKTTRQLMVTAPLDNSPAYKAGILPRDIIIEINNQVTENMRLEEALSLLRGEPNTSVFIKVKRGRKTLNMTVTRVLFDVQSVQWKIQNSSHGKVGYIRLNQFNSTASQVITDVINEFENQGVIGYILDLRSNSGGLLTESINIARLWLDRGLISIFTTREGYLQPEEANQSSLTRKPLVILVNEGSAAASELLASALQDNQRAKLIGTSTFGENTIQSVKTLSDGSAISFTIYKWLTPKGMDISEKGLIPDINIQLADVQNELNFQKEEIGTSSDNQYMKAIKILLEEKNKW